MIEFDQLSEFFSDFYDIKARGQFIYFDFHLHTTASPRIMTPPSVLAFLTETNHLISVTDHNDIRGAATACDKGLNNVPGMELVCEDGFELLVYFRTMEQLEAFYSGEVEKNKHCYRARRTTRDIGYYLDLLAERECYLSIPHINGLAQKNYLKYLPYMKNVLKRVNAIETYNHALPRNRNINAQIVRRAYQLEATFGSSALIARELMSFYRYLDQEERRHPRMLESLYRQSLVSPLAQSWTGQ
ncbi:PHP domain-containing protein [Photobacterium sp. DA100]|uniref:PHP domain-containing protein n=1 Tax=Photobacterium sp. DA100 TaxID=3027472 RepID=UPI00247AE491|nr:PHP domain-containing protein [Photobacterium sp. DA100]WEM43217.1 PHP domain-containing protein [Photobacterium sp. DA100]